MDQNTTQHIMNAHMQTQITRSLQVISNAFQQFAQSMVMAANHINMTINVKTKPPKPNVTITYHHTDENHSWPSEMEQ